MTMKKSIVIAIMAFFLSSGLAVAKEVNISYATQWPSAFVIGWAKGWFEKEMGVKVNFHEFDSGMKAAPAMVAGDIQINTTLGLQVIVGLTTKGFPIKVVGIAETCSEAENLAARDGTGIISPRDLVGKKIGVSLGSGAHYKLWGMFKVFGVKESEVQLIDMPGLDILAAFKRKDIDAGITWDPALSEMIKTGGHLLVSAEDMDRWGYPTIDIIAATGKFAEENPELLTKYLKVVDDSIRYFKKNPDECYKLMGEKLGITPEATKDMLSKIKFYTKEEQLVPALMGTKSSPGGVLKMITSYADFLVEQKSIQEPLKSYAPYFDPSYLEAIP
jgi:taurine transport system substrate-binding protein